MCTKKNKNFRFDFGWPEFGYNILWGYTYIFVYIRWQLGFCDWKLLYRNCIVSVCPKLFFCVFLILVPPHSAIVTTTLVVCLFVSVWFWCRLGRGIAINRSYFVINWKIDNLCVNKVESQITVTKKKNTVTILNQFLFTIQNKT